MAIDVNKVKKIIQEMDQSNNNLSTNEMLMYIMHKIDNIENKFLTIEEFKRWLTVFFSIIGLTWTLALALWLWIKSKLGV